MTTPSPKQIGSHGINRPAAVSAANQRASTSRAPPQRAPGHAAPRGRATSQVRARPLPCAMAHIPNATGPGEMLLSIGDRARREQERNVQENFADLAARMEDARAPQARAVRNPGQVHPQARPWRVMPAGSGRRMPPGLAEQLGPGRMTSAQPRGWNNGPSSN